VRIDNLDELRVFVEAAQRGSLSAAARTLNLSPAGASASLKRLENRLGARLFERSTRSIRLTPQGQSLIGYSLRAFELLKEGEAQIGASQKTLSGTIRVTAASALTRRLLLPWFDQFLATNENVNLALSVSDSPRDLLRDEVDLAIRYGPLADSGLVARLLASPRRIACASPRYLKKHSTPTHPRQLVLHECLTFWVRNRLHAQWKFEERGERYAVQVKGRRTVDDAEIAHSWALNHHGIIYVSELDVADSLKSGALVHLFRDFDGESIPLNAVLPSNRFVPARVRVLVDFLVSQFQKYAEINN
jgi:DNA-binding transcriptional LysR family regulator